MALRQYIRSVFTRILLSYVFDWAIIVIFIGIAGAFSFVEPIKRDFSLTDKSISFPYRKNTISMLVLFIVAVVAPAATIAAVCLAFVRLRTRPDTQSIRAVLWRRKLWELHAAWLGLALSLTLSLFMTQTLKNMFGRHRPDFLARCNPDLLTMDKYLVGGYTSELLEGTSQLVNWQICKSKDGSGVGRSEFIDGFRSFPSGHCTVAFAGLIYLSLFLAGKFSAVIQSLPPEPRESLPSGKSLDKRDEAAAPPLYLLVVVLIPAAAAIYIASTRFTDGKHAGFDVLFGSVEGLICAWFAFRWYHPPLRRGDGWAWAPRHQTAAFGIGMGIGSFVTHKDSMGKQKSREPHLEHGVQGGRGGGGVEMDDLEPVGTAAGSHESQRELV